MLALFLVINQIDGNVIQPLVMGSQAEVPPVLVLASFLVAGAFFGPAGLLLAVPSVIVVLTILDWQVLRGSPNQEEPDEQKASENDSWVRRVARSLKSGSS